MDSYGKQAAPARPGTNFDNNIRSQSFSAIRRHDNLQAQSEDKFDESSSIASISMSTTSMSSTSKITKCLKCKEEKGPLDPLFLCSKCSARFHRGCHNPTIGAEYTLDWRCSHCSKKYGMPLEEPPVAKESLGSTCEIPGCNKTIYSMLDTAKLDKVLCKYHEMKAKSERATKTQILALPRSSSKPIKKSKLYTVTYDEDMQGMKRRPGRKPGDMKKPQLSPNHSHIQPVSDNKPTARPQNIPKSENMLASRGALHPRTDNSAQVFKSMSTTQSQSKTGNTSQVNDVYKIPSKLQNRNIPSPSPEYEPPSPIRIESGANVWQSHVEQDDSPGSQIIDEFRAMQESTKKVVTKSAHTILQRSSSPADPLSQNKKGHEPTFAFTGKTPLFQPERAVKTSSAAVSPTPLFGALSSATNTSRPLLLKPVLDNKAKDIPPSPENGDRNTLSPNRQRKPKQNSVKDTESNQLNQQSQGLNKVVNKPAIPQPREKPPEPEFSTPQLQQTPANPANTGTEPQQKEPKHTAPLYGDYKPNTIEYKRQLRSKAYDPTVLDHFLNLQMKSQARAEVEKEQNLMPQPDTAAKTQIWGNIDPRVVWPKEQAEGWYEAKRKEIDARGGKKANFGILLTTQVRKERSGRGWHPNQNKDYVPKEERNGGSIFVADEGNSGEVELAIKDGKLGVLVPVAGKDGKVKWEKKFLPGDK